MDKRKLILIIVGALIIILAALWWLQRSGQINLRATQKNTSPAFKVEYLSAAEKNKLNISPDLKVQALQRDSGNTVTIYKIIKNNNDVVTNLSQIEAQRPPRPDKVPIK
ncbi:MAG: hypothetical protein NTX66_03305 [Candidatus Falkowbacteria bacterium]|nr:hypothetical protein [Candidatus Falkowbacteria bacterium]